MSHYKTMGDDEIARLPIQKISDENCLLFLWATGPKMDVAFEVGKTWGFKYATIAFVWEKVRVNPGTYTMSSCEYVLLFKKGIIPKPRGARNIRQFFQAMRGRHSEKPAQIRNRIVAMFPSQKKIELFAREKTKGWDVFGNEVKSDIRL